MFDNGHIQIKTEELYVIKANIKTPKVCTTVKKSVFIYLLYFFGYRTKFLLPKHPKNLDRSSYFGVFRNGKTHVIAKLHRTDVVISSHSRERGKPCLIAA